LELEKIEKKMDKWNLFDAIKYINSIRQDILNPLIDIRDLLLVQWVKLLYNEIEKQKFLSAENIVHTKLQSTRSFLIKEELDAYTEKLNTMIALLEWISGIKDDSNSYVDLMDVMITRLE
jgi:hypothetical protein